MASWITVYCRRSTSEITPQQLLDGIRGRDRSARAGVDYHTLAEDYDVDESLVDPALANLTVDRLPGGEDGCLIAYGGARSLAVRRWREGPRVAEEIAEIIERVERHPPAAVQLVETAREVIGIELGESQLHDMGVVIAYEGARYLAQKGDGVIHTDDGRWLRVESGRFHPVGPH